MYFHLLVPRSRDSSFARSLAPGSAIVTPFIREPPPERISVWYEGDVNHMGLRSIEERAFHAAGRAQQRYPTIARASQITSEMKAVATFSLHTRRIHRFIDPAALRAWAGSVPIFRNGLRGRHAEAYLRKVLAACPDMRFALESAGVLADPDSWGGLAVEGDAVALRVIGEAGVERITAPMPVTPHRRMILKAAFDSLVAAA